MERRREPLKTHLRDRKQRAAAQRRPFDRLSACTLVHLAIMSLPACAGSPPRPKRQVPAGAAAVVTLDSCQRWAAKPPLRNFRCDLRVRDAPAGARWLLYPDLGYIDEPVPEVVEAAYAIEEYALSNEPPGVFAVHVYGSRTGFSAVLLARRDLEWPDFEISSWSNARRRTSPLSSRMTSCSRTA